MKILKAIAGIIISTIAIPAQAGTIVHEVQGWSIIKEDVGCSMQMEYEGPGSSRLMFGRTEEHGIGVVITNYNWTAQKDESYDINFLINDTVYSGTGIGTSNGMWKGFVILMEEDFEQHLAQAPEIVVFLGQKKIDQLDLTGSSAAINAMNRCYAGVIREREAERAEKRKWNHLPKDPFAN